MKEIAKKEAAEKKINLRDLDDVACSNVVVARQIKRMIKKFPSMDDMPVDCWVHSGHYTRFKYKGGKFVWSVEGSAPCIKGCESITDDSDLLDKYELNRLIVSTYREMCDSQSGIDLVDTPEDLLAFAETKLQEMLREENTVYAEDVNTAASAE
jgi:hypothetical protein